MRDQRPGNREPGLANAIGPEKDGAGQRPPHTTRPWARPRLRVLATVKHDAHSNTGTVHDGGQGGGQMQS